MIIVTRKVVTGVRNFITGIRTIVIAVNSFVIACQLDLIRLYNWFLRLDEIKYVTGREAG
jgi:hypothetical protein